MPSARYSVSGSAPVLTSGRTASESMLGRTGAREGGDSANSGVAPGTARRAAATARAEANRPAGSLARQRRMTASTAGGPTPPSGAGSSWRIVAAVSAAVPR